VAYTTRSVQEKAIIIGIATRDQDPDQVEEFLNFLEGLNIHEAWLSEVKPSLEAFWNDNLIITEADRLKLVKLQDRYNTQSKMTVNYLGHFEGKECFGCNAGNKMVYVDTFGEVSPCVFTPLSFGNIHYDSLPNIFKEMKIHFPSEDRCFINKNYRLLQKYSASQVTLSKPDTLELMKEVRFGKLSKFNSLYYHSRLKKETQVCKTLIPNTGERYEIL